MNRYWDEAKNARNQRDHGISFETAWPVFGDPFSITTEDYIDDNGEMRYQTIGLIQGVLVTVAHVIRVIDGVESPWVIMARKAVKYEEDVYNSNRSKS